MKFIRLTAKTPNRNVPWIVNPKRIIGVAQAEDAEYATVYLVENNEIDVLESLDSIERLIKTK
jgi:hypothetical protein